MVYMIPFASGQFILAQVGRGSDLGVFAGVHTLPAPLTVENEHLLFRVHYDWQAPHKMRWIEVGKLPLHAALRVTNMYALDEIGSDNHYAIQYGEEDRLISSDDARKLEPAATWLHDDLVERFISTT